MSANRLIWVDCLRLVAGLSMLLLHATADSNGQAWPAYEASERTSVLLLRSIVYIARTELFLIISIFLLLMALERRPRTYAEAISEQARRLLIPFVFWAVFYAFYSLFKAEALGYSSAAIAQLGTFEAWIGFLLLGDVKYHMHFLPTLFGLLLLYPLFRLAVRFPALGLCVVFCLLIKQEVDRLLYQSFWGSEALAYYLRAAKILTYTGYGLFAGAMLGILNKVAAKERAKWIFPTLGVGAILFVFKLFATWETISLGKWAFENTPGYWADFLMPIVLFGVCLTLGHKKWPAVLSRIAPYSFGIYLCHPIFLDLAEIALHGTSLMPLQQVLLKIAFTVAATVVFVVGLSRTKWIAWTIGLGPLPSLARHQRFSKEAR